MDWQYHSPTQKNASNSSDSFLTQKNQGLTRTNIQPNTHDHPWHRISSLVLLKPKYRKYHNWNPEFSQQNTKTGTRTFPAT
ncbi:hypothetical protein METBIDRAFT_203441 [Metschnikowia bicuspidata var. bicuspidata NRRL YB-4993]|uniref:Uncharacterized protein n=1 Tax=Metschnikowia bicuspidata var. bicuspidata NRRL YB-4993 TaxID=869754 RepID=A0A1A0HA09_9ASCO|nr:hypothetical protein METBIDRAFT_203441 [Metschnikowia bicuspidata var. bicuspidata NRRL YB-4993]OBA20712.1 hypothetical protein METBIDRAFT_203441 [Metschnikowia bicuspidata var. bicuspidata NRRL YB-4993]